MVAAIELVHVTPENVENYGFCFYSDPKNERFQNKLEWFLNNYPLGLRYRVLYSNREKSIIGLLEYMPGKCSWRGIHAPDYMVIHCLMVKKEYSGQGWGSALIEHCVEDARESGFNGVAVISTKKTWCADNRVYLKNGFKVVEKTSPGLELVVKKIKKGAEPSFGKLEEKMAPYKKGVFMFYSQQCPFMSEGERLYGRQVELQKSFAVESLVLKIENFQEAQANPCAWGTYGIVANGSVINYIPGGYKGFLKGLKKKKIISDETKKTQGRDGSGY